jgi:hypothetical protein
MTVWKDSLVSSTAQRYQRFARESAARSPIYSSWSSAIADDDELIALIDTLPVADRQPVLVLSAARYTGLSTRGDIRAWLAGEWDSVAAVARTRATPTNDPRRSSTLLAALQGLDGPIALVEVGASAGLGLLVDRYSHVFVRGDEERRIDPLEGPSALELRCTLGPEVPLPERMPEIVWRVGLDRSPLRLDRPDDERWLRTLIWPEERTRAAQLEAAIGIAREHPPQLVAGDAVETVESLAAHAPADATVVIWSPAVLVYLAPIERDRFLEIASSLPGQWFSLDGRRVLRAVGDRADITLPGAEDDFLLSRNGEPLAVVSPHGERIERWAGG